MADHPDKLRRTIGRSGTKITVSEGKGQESGIFLHKL
jgi:hypothetical protein